MVHGRFAKPFRLSFVVALVFSMTFGSKGFATPQDPKIYSFSTQFVNKYSGRSEPVVNTAKIGFSTSGVTISWNGHEREIEGPVGVIEVPSAPELPAFPPKTNPLFKLLKKGSAPHTFSVVFKTGEVLLVEPEGPRAFDVPALATEEKAKYEMFHWIDSGGNQLSLIIRNVGEEKIGFVFDKHKVYQIDTVPNSPMEFSLNDGRAKHLFRDTKSGKLELIKLNATYFIIHDTDFHAAAAEVDKKGKKSKKTKKVDPNQELYDQSQLLDQQTEALNKMTGALNAQTELLKGDELILKNQQALVDAGMASANSLKGKGKKAAAAKVTERDPLKFTLEDPRLTEFTVKNEDGEDVEMAMMLKSFVEDIRPIALHPEEYDYFGKEIRNSLIGLNMQKGGSVRIVGAPGTGKTYYSDVLVSFIRMGLPGSEDLQDRLYVRLNASSLGAGTKYTGSMESRLSALKEAAALMPITLVVDEMHTLVGAGTHESNTNDFFQHIKSELASGAIKIIGTTTSGEWQRYFSKDQAMVDRFPIEVSIKEPTAEKMLVVMRSFLKSNYSNSKIEVSEKTLEHIVGTASRFDPIGANPRKSLRLLDYALSAAKIDKKGMIENADVIGYASALYGYDISSLSPHRIRERLVSFGTTVDQSMVGNDEAKLQMRETLGEHFFHQFNGTSRKPFAALLYGQRGVGKTSFATLIAKGLDFELSKIMMADYGHAYQVQSFLSRLAMAIRKNPYQVLMLDELEKADPAVQRAVLQVLEDGRFEANISDRPESNQLTEVDASKVIFIGTTNAGKDLANVPHTADQFEIAAEADGLNSYVLDRFSTRIPIKNPDLPAIDGILTLKWKDQTDLFAKSGHKIEVNVPQLVAQLKASGAKSSGGPSIGFMNSKSAEPADYSVRELERSIKVVSQKLSTYFMEHPEARSAGVTFQNGKWIAMAVPGADVSVSAGSPHMVKRMCSELFH